MLDDVAKPAGLRMVAADGVIALNHLVAALHITEAEMSVASGLSRDALTKSVRLHDVVEIINQVLPWAGSVYQAFAWYRAQPLPSFGVQTAEDLVKEGRAEAVKRHLSRIAVGGDA